MLSTLGPKERQELYNYCDKKKQDGKSIKSLGKTLGEALVEGKIKILDKERKTVLSFNKWLKSQSKHYKISESDHMVVDYLLDTCHYSSEEIKLIHDNYSKINLLDLGNTSSLDLGYIIGTHFYESLLRGSNRELSSALTAGWLCFDSKTGHLTGNFTIALHSSAYVWQSEDNLLGTISYEFVFTKEAREPLIIPNLHPEAQKQLDKALSDIQIIKISSNISAKSELAEEIEKILTSFKNAIQQVQKSFRQRHPGIYRGLIITGIVLAISLILASIIAIAIFTGGIGSIIIGIFSAVLFGAIIVTCGLGFLSFLLPSNDKSIDKSIEFSLDFKNSNLENQHLGTVSFPEKHLASTEEIVDTVTKLTDRDTHESFNPLEKDNDCVELIGGRLKIVVSKTSQPTASTSASTSSQNTSSYKVEFFGGQNFTKQIDLKPEGKTIAELCAEAAGQRGQSTVPQSDY